MSGRAYARTAQGFLGGGAHLESVVPHTFRLAPPKRSHSARELAIRRVIRRRCMEKNWKKLIARRHALAEAKEAEQQPQPQPQPQPTVAAAKQPESTAAVATGRRPKPEKKPDSETVGIAKRQLEDLEAKLQALVDEKHAKFLQLKTILVAEARSKSVGPPAATAMHAPAKKRRVETLKDPTASAAAAAASAASPRSEPSVASSPQHQVAAPGSHSSASSAAAAASGSSSA